MNLQPIGNIPLFVEEKKTLDTKPFWASEKRPTYDFEISGKDPKKQAYSGKFYGAVLVDRKNNIPNIPKEIVQSFIIDAEAGQYSFSDFCANFGHLTDSIQAKNMHDLCVRAYEAIVLFLGLEGAKAAFKEIQNF